MSWELRGKVAVVTGASSGLGRAMALRLAAEGMTVVAAARRLERLHELADQQDGIRPYGVDVTETAAVDELARWVEEELGACHALINNAGVPGGAFEGRDDLETELHTVDVNLLGALRCLAAFAALLERSAPSRVVNVASVAGKIGIGPAGYAASKFGLVGLSEALGFSWAPRGITVSQLNPGYIETEGFPQDQVKRGPMARLLREPSDVSDAVVELLREGTPERTVPRIYRAFIVVRHIAAPIYRRLAAKTDRAKGSRD